MSSDREMGLRVELAVHTLSALQLVSQHSKKIEARTVYNDKAENQRWSERESQREGERAKNVVSQNVVLQNGEQGRTTQRTTIV